MRIEHRHEAAGEERAKQGEGNQLRYAHAERSEESMVLRKNGETAEAAQHGEEDGAQLSRYGCGAERMDASGDFQQTMNDGPGTVAQHGKEPEKAGEHAVTDDAPAHMQDRIDALRNRIDRRGGC